MNRKTLELEGTWEEILTKSEQFAGHRVRVTILATETEIKQAIAEESAKELEQLNSDYLIHCNQTNLNQEINIRFGDLPKYEQESIQQALASQARGELERWEFE